MLRLVVPLVAAQLLPQLKVSIIRGFCALVVYLS